MTQLPLPSSSGLVEATPPPSPTAALPPCHRCRRAAASLKPSSQSVERLDRQPESPLPLSSGLVEALRWCRVRRRGGTTSPLPSSSGLVEATCPASPAAPCPPCRHRCRRAAASLKRHRILNDRPRRVVESPLPSSSGLVEARRPFARQNGALRCHRCRRAAASLKRVDRGVGGVVGAAVTAAVEQRPR